MRLFSYCLAIIFLTSCASYKPPQARNVNNTTMVAASYENTWNQIVEFLALSNISIDKIEKESGLINGGATLSRKTAVVDCGKITGGGENNYNNAGFRVNVIIRKINADNTKVTVTLVGGATVSAFSWGATIATNYEERVSTTCLSTGLLEDQLFRFLKGDLSEEQLKSENAKI
jgi:hypothetical protein